MNRHLIILTITLGGFALSPKLSYARGPAYISFQAVRDTEIRRKKSKICCTLDVIREGEAVQVLYRSEDGKLFWVWARTERGVEGWVRTKDLKRKPKDKPWSYTKSTTLESGAQMSLGTNLVKTNQTTGFARLYVLPKFQAQLEPSDQATAKNYFLDVSLRGTLQPASEGGNEVMIRSLTVGTSNDRSKTTLGFQEVAWGETFGVYIADLVNPRDFRDPLNQDLSWTRLPVFMINQQFFLNNLAIQLIFIPVPRSAILPGANSYFDLRPAALAGLPVQSYPSYGLSDIRRESEWGSRIGRIFESGWDTSLFFLHHHNRNVVLSVEGNTLVPAQVMTNSLGFSYSKALQKVVIRGDHVFHQGQPRQQSDFSAPSNDEQLQSIIGADFDGGTIGVVGAQLHWDYWLTGEKASKGETWASFNLSRSLWRDHLKTEVFYFRGINSSDQWLEPRITFNATPSLSLWAAGDFLSGVPEQVDSLIGPISSKSRIFLGLTHHL